MSQLYVVSSY